MTKSKVLSYNKLKELKTFDERYEYLRQGGIVGQATFGFDRYINQALYQSSEWKKARRQAILRDEGNDLGITGYPLGNRNIVVHHMNPITEEDIENRDPKLFDLDNLICCSKLTHNAIHYGDAKLLEGYKEIDRAPNDQCPWK